MRPWQQRTIFSVLVSTGHCASSSCGPFPDPVLPWTLGDCFLNLSRAPAAGRTDILEQCVNAGCAELVAHPCREPLFPGNSGVWPYNKVRQLCERQVNGPRMFPIAAKLRCTIRPHLQEHCWVFSQCNDGKDGQCGHKSHLNGNIRLDGESEACLGLPGSPAGPRIGVGSAWSFYQGWLSKGRSPHCVAARACESLGIPGRGGYSFARKGATV